MSKAKPQNRRIANRIRASFGLERVVISFETPSKKTERAVSETISTKLGNRIANQFLVTPVPEVVAVAVKSRKGVTTATVTVRGTLKN